MAPYISTVWANPNRKKPPIVCCTLALKFVF
jgi:hypothetical protein